MSANPPFRSLVLDSEGLVQASERGERVGALIARAREVGARVFVPWTVLVETLQGSGKPKREYALSRLTLLELTEDHYRDAAALMDATGMGGHTIDALVIAAARRCSKPVVIATSDPKDLNKLLQNERHVAVVRV